MNNELAHYGKLGMKWGQHKVQRQATKDATRHEVARQAYGKGAGIQRRLIKKEVEEKMKDPEYKKHYEKALESINYAKINKKAVSNSRGRAAKDQTKRSAKMIAKTLTGTTSLAAGYIYYTQHKDLVDSVVRNAMRQIPRR